MQIQDSSLLSMANFVHHRYRIQSTIYHTIVYNIPYIIAYGSFEVKE